MWDLPGPGLEPVSPALAGEFLTTAPPGKSPGFWFFERSQKYGLVCEISYILNLGQYFGGQTEYVLGIPFCAFYTNIFSPVFRPKVMTVSVRELFKFCNLI